MIGIQYVGPNAPAIAGRSIGIDRSAEGLTIFEPKGKEYKANIGRSKCLCWPSILAEINIHQLGIKHEHRFLPCPRRREPARGLANGSGPLLRAAEKRWSRGGRIVVYRQRLAGPFMAFVRQGARGAEARSGPVRPHAA